MKKTCFITGAGGFVGAAMVRRCLDEDFDVSVLLRKTKSYWRLKDYLRKLHVLEGDIIDAGVIEKIAAIRPDYMFHFATYGAYPQEEDFSRMIDVNIRGIHNLVEAAKRSSTKLLINTGSSSEYGIKDAPMKETDSTTPINDYGVTKAAATLYCQKEAIRSGVPVITFRLFSVYGPYEEKQRLVPTVVRGAITGESIALSSPEIVRDYVYMDDVISAYMTASEVTHEPGAIYNIGSGYEHTIHEVADMVKDLTRSKSVFEWGKVKKQARQMEPKHWVADISKAKKIFNWEPRYSLKKGLVETVAWFRKNKSLYE